jgi:hypothetical protein
MDMHPRLRSRAFDVLEEKIRAYNEARRTAIAGIQALLLGPLRGHDAPHGLGVVRGTLTEALQALNSLPESGAPTDGQHALLTDTLEQLRTALASLSQEARTADA